MENLFHKLISSALLIPALLGNLFFPGLSLKQELADTKAKLLEAQQELLGSTFQTPEARALFETSISSKISSTATSFTLTSATDKDGNTLASSTYGFILDEGTADEEIILADCTGTTCTNATRGLSVNTGTTTVSALKKPHRAGASIKMTDAPLLIFLKNALKGKQNIENIMTYDSSITAGSFTTGSNQLASVAYADALSFAGAPNASETAKGISELATAAEAANGVTSGSTAARLVLPASIATSTYQAGSSNRVVITNGSNQIDANFIATSSSYTWSGTNNFTANLGISTSSPYAPLSVVGAGGVVAGKYHATSTTATSTFDGALKLSTTGKGLEFPDGSIQFKAPEKVYAISDLTGASGNFSSPATTSVMSIPAGILTASSTIDFSGSWAFSGAGGVNISAYWTLNINGAPVCQVTLLSDTSTPVGEFSGSVYADSLTSQDYRCKAFGTLIGGDIDGGTSAGFHAVEGTSAINFANATTFSVTVKTSSDNLTNGLQNLFIKVNP